MENVNFEGQPVNPDQNPNEAPKAPNYGPNQENTKKKKLIWAGVVLAVLVLSVAGWQYWQYIHSVYYQQMKAVKMLEEMAKESDKYGGKTPEETVRLFTEAVKKGDFDLASKYGRQEEIKLDLEKIKNDGNIGLLIKDLEVGVVKEGNLGPQYADLIVVEESGGKYTVLSMYKSENGIWKIVTF